MELKSASRAPALLMTDSDSELTVEVPGRQHAYGNESSKQIPSGPCIYLPPGETGLSPNVGRYRVKNDSVCSASSASRNGSTEDGQESGDPDCRREDAGCSGTSCTATYGDPGDGRLIQRIQKLSIVCDSEADEDCEEPFVDRARRWNMQRRGPRLGSSLIGAGDFNEELTADAVRKIINCEELLFSSEPFDGELPEEFSEKRPKIKNGYLFGDVIGEGSYAKVKEIVEQHSLVRRAVKIVKMNRLRKIPNGKENVEREIRLLRKINHKNVIELIEVFRNDVKGKLYMVMEFCMGSVQQLIDSATEKRLTEQKAHFLFVQLVRGLEYIHSVGIIHKDVKPANLLISAEFVLKLSDFGVAEEIDLFQGNDNCSIVQGTPKFQAPELVSGSAEYYSGFKADVWSSGITLYNMVSGHYPFNGDVLMQLFTNIETQELEMPTNIVVGSMLEKLLRGMLAKRPCDRYSIDQIIHSEWFVLGRVKELLHVEEADVKKEHLYRPLSVSRALEILYDNRNDTGFIFVDDPDDEGGDRPDSAASGGMAATSSQIPAPISQRRRNRSLLNCFFPNH